IVSFRSRQDLILENLAFRHQLLAVHSKRPRRRSSTIHKLFWITLRRLWSEWKRPLILVSPRTVVAWHRAGFRLYWKWLSRAKRVGGRNRVSQEVRALQSLLTSKLCRRWMNSKPLPDSKSFAWTSPISLPTYIRGLLNSM